MGLRPTNGKLLKSIWALKIQPRIEEHMKCMLTGKIKCRSFWSEVPGLTERAYCPFCKEKRNLKVIETRLHMWLECTNGGQAQGWEMMERIWCKTTHGDWPPITLGQAPPHTMLVSLTEPLAQQESTLCTYNYECEIETHTARNHKPNSTKYQQTPITHRDRCNRPNGTE